MAIFILSPAREIAIYSDGAVMEAARTDRFVGARRNGSLTFTIVPSALHFAVGFRFATVIIARADAHSVRCKRSHR